MLCRKKHSCNGTLSRTATLERFNSKESTDFHITSKQLPKINKNEITIIVGVFPNNAMRKLSHKKLA